jgi:hypothetical protein
MTTIAPNKVVLTCNVTGKTVTWTNKSIIQKKIDQYGSLETFMSKYTSKGAGKKSTVKKVGVVLKPVLEEGVKMGKMSQKEYNDKYVTTTYQYKDGLNCTVSAPKVTIEQLSP